MSGYTEDCRLPGSEPEASDDRTRGELVIRNGFFDVDQGEILEQRKIKRSNSWSGSSNSESSSALEPYAFAQLKKLQESDSSVSVDGEAQALQTAESKTTADDGAIVEETMSNLRTVLPTKLVEDTLADLENPQEVEYGWSAGSKLHESRKCSPCLEIVQKGRCAYGEGCKFCHLQHKSKELRKLPSRPNKNTRLLCKQSLTRMGELLQNDPVRMRKAYEQLSEKHPYMRTLLKGLLSDDACAAGESTASSSQAVGVAQWTPQSSQTTLKDANEKAMQRQQVRAPRQPGLQQPQNFRASGSPVESSGGGSSGQAQRNTRSKNLTKVSL